MSVYKQYTLTSKQKLIGFYRCPQCGNNNLFMFDCMAQTGYNTKGAFRQSTINARGLDAQNRLHTEQIRKINDILWAAERHDYKPAKLQCKCQKCNTVEPWAKYHLPLVSAFSTLAKYALLFTGLFSVWTMLDGTNSVEIFTAPAISALVWLICVITDIINTEIRNKQVAKIDPSYLPIIDQKPDVLISKIKEKFPNETDLFNQSKASPFM